MKSKMFSRKKYKLITCTIPKGKGMPLARLLHDKKKINTVNVTHGRGGGRRGRIEVEILTVVVPAKQAKEIFEFIFYEADVDTFHGGFMYQGDLLCASDYILPEQT